MKAKIKSTGEIVDVSDYRFGSKISSENFVVYTDSHGRVHLDSDVDFSEDFEEVSDEEVRNSDKWEQRRYEVAKEMLPITYQESRNILLRGGDVDTPDIITSAVKFADMLIAELKKGGINGSH